MLMEYNELTTLFWDMTAALVGDMVRKPAAKYIRYKYPVDGKPDWRITDNIVFLNLSERADPYGQQNDSVYKTEGGTVIRRRGRTRVWDVLFTAYGPSAYEMVNKIRDDVFTEPVKAMLSKHAVFLIPDLPTCRQIPELYAGKWWARWDLTLHFNEWYESPPEDVGHVETVELTDGAVR